MRLAEQQPIQGVTRRKVLWMIGGISAYLAVPAPVLPKSPIITPWKQELFYVTLIYPPSLEVRRGKLISVPGYTRVYQDPCLKENVTVSFPGDDEIAAMASGETYWGLRTLVSEATPRGLGFVGPEGVPIVFKPDPQTIYQYVIDKLKF